MGLFHIDLLVEPASMLTYNSLAKVLGVNTTLLKWNLTDRYVVESRLRPIV